VDERSLIGAELDLAGLDLLDGGGDIGRNGAGLGIRHEALGAEYLAETADGLHHVGRCDQGVKGCPAFFLDLFDELFAAEELGTSGFRVLDLVARGDDGDDLGLAEAVGENDGAADHLVSVARVNTEAEGQVDGLVELGVLRLLEQGDRIGQGVGASFNKRARLRNILGRSLSHVSSSATPRALFCKGVVVDAPPGGGDTLLIMQEDLGSGQEILGILARFIQYSR